MKRGLVSLLFSLLSLQVFASQLMSNDLIYELSEALHSARYDYEGGVSFKLVQSYNTLEFNDHSKALSFKNHMCKSVDAKELLQELDLIANVHLLSFEEDSELVYQGISELADFFIGKHFKRCFDGQMNSYISYNGRFLYSLNKVKDQI